MHADDAGWIDDEQLVQWYDVAVAKAAIDTVDFANQNALSDDNQFHVYCAIANFHEELYVYYAFRARDFIQFECARCEIEFEGELDHEGFEFHFEKSEKPWAEREKYRLIPSNDILSAIKRVGQKRFSRIATLATDNNHLAIVRWLEKRLGDFQCPACDKPSWAIEFGMKD